MAYLPRRSRGWIWFFALLTGLVLVWAGGSLLFQRYYWGTAVTPERLAEARARWRAHGPGDYDCEVVQQGTVSSRVVVHVRDQRVVYAEPDQRPLTEKARDYGVPALFERIEQALKQDTEPGHPPAKACARFDPQDGHPVRYVHQIPGTGDTVQITIAHFRPVAETARR